MNITYTIGAIFIVSLMSLVGLLVLGFKTETLSKLLMYMVSFAAGALLGDAFLHLIPEAAHEHGFSLEMSIWILGGVIVFFAIEQFIQFHHCHSLPEEHDHPHPFAWMNLIGDMVHNFLDGLIIAASFMVSVEVGIATTIAVVLHEIPQEIGDFGVLLHGGFSKKKALLLNFATALTAFAGAILGIFLVEYNETIMHTLIPFAAGGFIYIACSDLIPELHKETTTGKSILRFIMFLAGIAVMYGLLFIGHGHDEDTHLDEDIHHEEVTEATHSESELTVEIVN